MTAATLKYEDAVWSKNAFGEFVAGREIGGYVDVAPGQAITRSREVCNKLIAFYAVFRWASLPGGQRHSQQTHRRIAVAFSLRLFSLSTRPEGDHR